MDIVIDEKTTMDGLKPRLMTLEEQRESADKLIKELKDSGRITAWEAKDFSRRWVRL